MPQLLTNATVTGSVTQWGGGTGVFEVVASAWNGATVSLQKQQLDGSFVDVGVNTTLTANGQGAFLLPPCSIKAVVRTAVPAGVNAAAWKVRS